MTNQLFINIVNINNINNIYDVNIYDNKRIILIFKNVKYTTHITY